MNQRYKATCAASLRLRHSARPPLCPASRPSRRSPQQRKPGSPDAAAASEELQCHRHAGETSCRSMAPTLGKYGVKARGCTVPIFFFNSHSGCRFPLLLLGSNPLALVTFFFLNSQNWILRSRWRHLWPCCESKGSSDPCQSSCQPRHQCI